jgi:hypothetical protein
MAQVIDFNQLINTQMRNFASKKKKKRVVNPETGVSESEFVTDEEHDIPTPSKADFSAATAQQSQEPVSRDLFKAFSLGDIRQIQSTPDHKPPTSEDTIEGRYAAVLFTSASQSEALFTVYEDITYIQQMYDNSESFKLFTQNAGVGAKEIRLFNEALNGLGQFHPLTIKFLEVLAENKRLIYISGIAQRYQKLY